MNIIDHKVYGKVLAEKNKLVIIQQNKLVEAQELAKQYNGIPVKSMAGNWIIQIKEEHGAGFIGTDELLDNYKKMTPGQSTILVRKNKYKEDGEKPSVKSIKEWIDKPETKALYLTRYGTEEIASQKLLETSKKLEESLLHNEIIHNKKTIKQLRKG